MLLRVHTMLHFTSYLLRDDQLFPIGNRETELLPKGRRTGDQGREGKGRGGHIKRTRCVVYTHQLSTVHATIMFRKYGLIKVKLQRK